MYGTILYFFPIVHVHVCFPLSSLLPLSYHSPFLSHLSLSLSSLSLREQDDEISSLKAQKRQVQVEYEALKSKLLQPKDSPDSALNKLDLQYQSTLQKGM